MTTINFGKTVTLKQAAALIASCPEIKFFLQGEPGIGKSSVLPIVNRMMPGHLPSYIDVSTMDLGDIGYPAMDHEAKVARFYPNARFRMTEKKPVIIMMDEFTKGMDPVKNMLHPLLEVNNPRLGDVPLPAGSIVFLTGNLASDGVGDSLKGHSRSRVTVLHVSKPSADEWLAWAITVGSEASTEGRADKKRIEPVVLAWVRQYPQALASYLDEGQTENPYIYNPRKQQQSYVTPRSLELVSHIVRNRDSFDEDSLLAAMSGTIGESAARDMQAYIAYQDQLPTWETIIANPDTAKVPDSVGACAVLVYGAVQRVTKESLPAFMTYVERFSPEWQAVFAVNMAQTRQSVAFTCKAFTNWVQRNQDVLGA